MQGHTLSTPAVPPPSALKSPGSARKPRPLATHALSSDAASASTPTVTTSLQQTVPGASASTESPLNKASTAGAGAMLAPLDISSMLGSYKNPGTGANGIAGIPLGNGKNISSRIHQRRNSEEVHRSKGNKQITTTGNAAQTHTALHRTSTALDASAMSSEAAPSSSSPLLPLNPVLSFKKKHPKKRRTSHKGLMSRLALQFPMIRHSFLAVYNVFERHMLTKSMRGGLASVGLSSNSETGLSSGAGVNSGGGVGRRGKRNSTVAVNDLGLLTVHQLESVMAAVGAAYGGHQFSEEEVQKLFQLVDFSGKSNANNSSSPVLPLNTNTAAVDAAAPVALSSNSSPLQSYASASSSSSSRSSQTITFKEFLTAVAIGYFLSYDYPSDTAFTEIQRGFKAVEKAFRDMDDDQSNSVDAQELKNALFSASSLGTSNEILELRFKELDFNADGDVSLPEFMYCLLSWVGFADEEEDGGLMQYQEGGGGGHTKKKSGQTNINSNNSNNPSTVPKKEDEVKTESSNPSPSSPSSKHRPLVSNPNPKKSTSKVTPITDSPQAAPMNLQSAEATTP